MLPAWLRGLVSLQAEIRQPGPVAVEPTDEQRARWGIPGAVVAGAFVAGTIALGVLGLLRWDRDSLGYGLVLVVGLAALFSMVRNLRGNTGTKWPWHAPGWLQVVLVFTMLMLAYLSKALNFYGGTSSGWERRLCAGPAISGTHDRRSAVPEWRQSAMAVRVVLPESAPGHCLRTTPPCRKSAYSTCAGSTS